MSYYLPRTNVKKLCEEVFGSDIEEMSFLYNKTYKYWYRVTKGDIIQFLSMRRYNGGNYDISFACQPLFVSIWLSFIDDKRGAPPYFEAEDGTVVLNSIMEVANYTPANLPKLNTRMCVMDPIDDIKRHMRTVFDVVIKPVLMNSLDVSSCYEEYKRIRDIRNAIIKMYCSKEKWEDESRIIAPIDALTYLYQHDYDDGLNRALGRSGAHFHYSYQ